MVNRFTEMPALGRPAAESVARARAAAAGQRIATANMLSGGAISQQGATGQAEARQGVGQLSARQRACDSFWRCASVTRLVSQGN